LALKDLKIPATMNVTNPDENLDKSLLKIVTETKSENDASLDNSNVRRLILKNSFGFGGTNVSLLLGQFTL
jgi:3-oxoacyl-(acyl-carrier-protein) synthase